jgi:outer membrane lipoprotein-sorting protein
MTEKLSKEDQVLDAAVQALRQEALAEEAPPALLAQLSAMGRAPGVEESRPLARARSWRMKRLQPLRVAAVVLLAVGGLVGLGALLRTGSTLAYADVTRPFRDVDTLTFQMSVQSPHLPKLLTYKEGNLNIQVFLKEPSRFRLEGPYGLIGIGFLGQDESQFLALVPLIKTAGLVIAKGNLQQFDDSDPMDWVKRLRGLAEKRAQPAGKRQIGAVEAHGFLVKEGEEETLVWADPKTRLPILIEESDPEGWRTTYSDFRFNPELDDALFSLEVPKGYKLYPFEIEALPAEEHLVRLLRSYAEASAGKFPPRLEDSADLAHAIKNPMSRDQNHKAREGLGPHAMRKAFNIVWTSLFVNSLKGGYGYLPEGAQLGDADRILFWYRPARATKSRVLYADLHWADVSTDQLPKKTRPWTGLKHRGCARAAERKSMRKRARFAIALLVAGSLCAGRCRGAPPRTAILRPTVSAPDTLPARQRLPT